ncbi:MAG: hypothetical protein ACFFD2_27845, partial [Promethearchaeota archaeon]
MSSIDKIRQKTVIIFFIFIIFAPAFFLSRGSLNLQTIYSAPLIQNNIYSGEIIQISDPFPKTELLSQKISIKFQELLKTSNL